MDSSTVRRVLQDLIRIDQVMVVMDSGDAVSQMRPDGLNPPQFENDTATIQARGWSVRMDMGSVAGVQFVEAEDHREAVPKMYYARFYDQGGGTLLRFYFPNPWLDGEDNATEFQPERLRLFEEYRDRWFGTEGVAFVRQRGRQTAGN